MTIRFSCPACGKKLKAGDAAAGRKTICSGCGAKVMVPEEDGASGQEPGTSGQGPVASGHGHSLEEELHDPSVMVMANSSHGEDLIDMTPMVDVVLFLLIFFLVTSVQALQAVIDMPTPQAVGATSKGRSIAEYEQDPDFISVRIEDDDSIWVEDEQTFADQDLRVKLRAAAAERPRVPSVVVIGDAEASHGAAVRVFDACAYTRVKDVSFVVQEGDAR